MFQTKVVQKMKTHFMFSKYFPKNRAVYEMWKNVVPEKRTQAHTSSAHAPTPMPPPPPHTHTNM
jgi:hypothetical protein